MPSVVIEEMTAFQNEVDGENQVKSSETARTGYTVQFNPAIVHFEGLVRIMLRTEAFLLPAYK